VGTIAFTFPDGTVYMEAETSMTPADQSKFGHLDLNLVGIEPSLDTDWALCDNFVEDESSGPREALDLRFFGEGYDVYIGFSIEERLGVFGVDEYRITDEFDEFGNPLGIHMWYRYMVDGIGFDNQNPEPGGMLTITEWDETHAAGRFFINAPHEMTGNFNMPFSDEAELF